MKKDKKKIIVTLIIAILLILIGIVLLAKRNNLMVIEKGIKDSVLYIEKIIISPFNKKNDCNKDYLDNNLVIENIELKKELKELKETLDLKNLLSDKKIINTTIVHKDIEFWFDSITLDKGKKDGIDVDMAVVNSKGLVGKTTKVSYLNTEVTLLTSLNIGKISVKIQNEDEFIYGLLNGYNSDNNTFKIEGISQYINIKEGAVVTTTGLSNTFPGGIVIGKVKNSKSDAYDLAQELEVEPIVNFNDLGVVSIVERSNSD